jgi:hypothetical protein
MGDAYHEEGAFPPEGQHDAPYTSPPPPGPAGVVGAPTPTYTPPPPSIASMTSSPPLSQPQVRHASMHILFFLVLFFCFGGCGWWSGNGWRPIQRLSVEVIAILSTVQW